MVNSFEILGFHLVINITAFWGVWSSIIEKYIIFAKENIILSCV